MSTWMLDRRWLGGLNPGDVVAVVHENVHRLKPADRGYVHSVLRSRGSILEVWEEGHRSATCIWVEDGRGVPNQRWKPGEDRLGWENTRICAPTEEHLQWWKRDDLIARLRARLGATLPSIATLEKVVELLDRDGQEVAS